MDERKRQERTDGGDVEGADVNKRQGEARCGGMRIWEAGGGVPWGGRGRGGERRGRLS